MGRRRAAAWNRIGAARSAMPADVELTVEQMTPSVFPDHLGGPDRRRQPVAAARLRLLPAGPADQEHPRRAMRQRRRRRPARDRGRGPARRPAGRRPVAPPTSPTRSARPIASSRSAASRSRRSPTQIIVNTQGETAQQIEDLVISTKNDQPLRVRDVADVKIMHQDRVQSVGFEGKDAVVVTIFRQRAATRSTSRTTCAELLGPATAAAQHPGHGGLRPGPFRQHRRRQRARRHPGRRPVQHPDPAGLPAELAGHADLGAWRSRRRWPSRSFSCTGAAKRST